jgi:hypothetical protein
MSNKKKSRLEPKPWFKQVRGSYLPNSTIGWLTYIPFVSYLLLSLIVSVLKTSSILLAVIIAIPNWVAAATVLTCIAVRRSR